MIRTGPPASARRQAPGRPPSGGSGRGSDRPARLARDRPVHAPAPIAAKISDDLRAVLNELSTRKRFEDIASYIHPMSGAELLAYIRTEQALWKPVIEHQHFQAGILSDACFRRLRAQVTSLCRGPALVTCDICGTPEGDLVVFA